MADTNPFDVAEHNPFDAADIGAPNPFDAHEEQHAAATATGPKAVDASPNPFDDSTITTRGNAAIAPVQPAVSEADKQHVRNILAKMPYYVEGFLGPQDINGQAKIYAPGEYEATVFGPKADTDKALEEANAEFDKSDKGVMAELQRQAKISAAYKQNVDRSNPLNVIGKTVIGGPLRTAQELIGRPAASIAVKSLMGVPLAQDNPNSGQLGAPPVPMATEEELRKLGIKGPIGQFEQPTISSSEREQREFIQRHKGATLAELRQPGKYVTPGAPELLYRTFLSSLGSEQMKLTPEKEAEARTNITSASVPIPLVGDVEISKVVVKAAELGGELPFYAIGTTGAGARVTAGLEKELGGSLVAKEAVAATAKARRIGGATEFAAQSAIIAAKNKEDIGSSAMMGYVGGNVLEYLGQLAFGKRAIQKEILSEVNASRADWREAGVLLPPVTWREYVKIGEKMGPIRNTGETLVGGRGTPEDIKAAGFQSKAPERPIVEIKPQVKQLGPEPKLGDENAAYSFATIERGRSGELREVRYLDNAKTGKRKKVYSERWDFANEGRGESGPMVATDGDAFSEYLNIRHPTKETIRQGWGKEGYKSPEEAAALIDLGYIKPSKKSPLPSERDNLPTRVDPMTPQRVENMRKQEAPVLLATDKNGNVKITVMVDRTPDSSALSPRPLEIGDAVQLADGTPGVVSKIDGDKLTIDRFSKPTIDVSQFDVAQANENLLNLNELLAPVSASPGKGEQILKLKTLDIKRVMNATGDPSPVRAYQMLKDMQELGQIESRGDGTWKVAKSYKAEIPDTPLQDKDYVFYYSTSEGGSGKAGVLRGRDPKKPGNYLVEVAIDNLQDVPGPREAALATQYGSGQFPITPHDVATRTQLKSVPKDQLRPYAPILGNATRSSLPAQYGVSVPMPADAFILSTAASKAIADGSRMAGQLNKIISKKQTIQNGLMRLFNNEAWLVPTDVRGPATSLAAQPGLLKAKAEVYQETLGSRIGLGTANDAWLANIATRQATRSGKPLSDQQRGLMRFFASNPQYNAEVRSTVEAALQRLKSYEQQLGPLVGKIGDLEAMRAAGLEDEYVMNVYLKYMMARKDFGKFVKEQLPAEWNKAVELITQRNRGEFQFQTEDDMMSILGMNKKELIQQAAKNPNGNAAKNLKKREFLEKEIQGIIGKVDSASVQIAYSLATAESLLNRIKLWSGLADTPYWSPGPRPDLSPNGVEPGGLVIPNLPIYGKAAGGRIHESFKFLLEAKPHQEGQSIFRALRSVWKFNEVVAGGFSPWVNQVMRNWKGLLISGGLQGSGDFATFFDAAEMMLKYRQNPILYKGSIYEAAMNNGAVGTGFAGSEINKNKAVKKILNAIRSQKGNSTSYWDLMSNVSATLKGGAEDVGAMYDAIDRLFKLTAYMNNYRRCISRGMSIDDAAAFSTMRNNQSFVNFEMVSPAVEKMRNGNIGGMAPFLSSKAEDLRINGTLLMRLRNEPDLQARVLAAGSALAVAGALMREQRRANGITDDMARKAVDAPKLATQAFHPMATVWPELDSEGRIQLVDFTQWDDLFIMMQMHERDFAPAAIIRNNLTGLYGEENFIGRGIDMGFNAAFGTVPLSQQAQMIERPGEQSVAAEISKIAQGGGLPTGPFRAYNYYKNTLPPQTVREQLYKEQWTPEQQKIKTLGLPFYAPIGKKTETARAKEALNNLLQMKYQMEQAIMSLPPGQQQEVLKAKIKAIEEVAHEYEENH